MQALILLTIVASAYASYPNYSECYREGDIVLDTYNRCKYRTCERVEPENGYAHFELKEKECAEGTGAPYFLHQQYMHGVYAGHRFIGSHLASTVCADKHVKDCTAHFGHGHGYGNGYGHGYGYPGHGHFSYGFHGHNVGSPAATAKPTAE